MYLLLVVVEFVVVLVQLHADLINLAVPQVDNLPESLYFLLSKGRHLGPVEILNVVKHLIELLQLLFLLLVGLMELEVDFLLVGEHVLQLGHCLTQELELLVTLVLVDGLVVVGVAALLGVLLEGVVFVFVEVDSGAWGKGVTDAVRVIVRHYLNLN